MLEKQKKKLEADRQDFSKNVAHVVNLSIRWTILTYQKLWPQLSSQKRFSRGALCHDPGRDRRAEGLQAFVLQ